MTKRKNKLIRSLRAPKSTVTEPKVDTIPLTTQEEKDRYWNWILSLHVALHRDALKST